MTTEQLAVWFQDKAQFCGCGSPEEAAKRLMDILALHPLYELGHEFEELLPDNGFQHLILYWLDSLGLTEHGGSVSGGWLTPDGESLLAALRVEHERDGFEALFETRCVHGFLATDAGHDCMAADREAQA